MNFEGIDEINVSQFSTREARSFIAMIHSLFRTFYTNSLYVWQRPRYIYIYIYIYICMYNLIRDAIDALEFLSASSFLCHRHRSLDRSGVRSITVTFPGSPVQVSDCRLS
jgi:hypothetical protein